MVSIKDFASNSIMGVVRKIVNYIVDTLQVQVQNNTDHLPSAFNGSFDDSTKNLTLTIESQGASAENLTAVVNIPTSGSGETSYTAGTGIDISSGDVISVDNTVIPYKTDVQDCFNEVSFNSSTGEMSLTALDGQVNSFTIPISAGSDWVISNENFGILCTSTEYKLIRVDYFVAEGSKGTYITGSAILSPIASSAYGGFTLYIATLLNSGYIVFIPEATADLQFYTSNTQRAMTRVTTEKRLSSGEYAIYVMS